MSYFQLNTDQFNPLPFPASYPGYGNRQDGVRQKNLVANHTWQLSERLVNNARFNFMRRVTPWDSLNHKTIREYGSKANIGATPLTPPRFFINGRWNMGNYDATGYDQGFSGSDTLTLLLGNHNLTFGTWYLHGIYHENGSSAGGSDSTYSGTFTGNALADFMLGRPVSFTVDNGNFPDLSSNSIHTFFQDDWKFTPRLTLNLGVRYEITTPLVWTTNYIPSFQQGVQSKVFPNAPKGMLYYGDPSITRAGRKTDYNNIAPRVGFAYDVFGKGATSLRGAYGIYFLAQYGDGVRSSQPYGVAITTNTAPSLVDPWNTANGGTDPFPSTLNPSNPTFVKPITVIHFSPDSATPYVQQFNLSVQQQFAPSVSGQIAYVGTRSRKMQINFDENYPIFIPGASAGGANSTTSNLNQRRPFNGATPSSAVPSSAVTFSQVAEYSTAANASYDALQASLIARRGHGTTLVANYTWAKTLDLVSGDQYNNSISLIDSRNPRLDKGNSDGQPHHIFSASGIYELPGTHRFGFVGKQIISGWQLNGILTARSGVPFTVTSGVDTNVDGINNDRPNLFGNPSGAGTLTNYLNRAAFAVPTLGQNGNVGRNTFFGPKNVNMNATLMKNFSIERNRVEFRWEAFNAPNHTNFNNPTSNLSSGNFGVITGSSAARIMQFAYVTAFEPYTGPARPQPRLNEDSVQAEPLRTKNG